MCVCVGGGGVYATWGPERYLKREVERRRERGGGGGRERGMDGWRKEDTVNRK